jgi:uncharacterized protein (TIGR02145 family)
MKNLYLLFSFALMSIFAFGQTPQAFKYQAIARDLNGNPVINQEISVKISILSGSPEGTVEYCELHQTISNSLGLINLEVGRGTAVTGNFELIIWGKNASFIKTEMDLAGGDNFVFMGTSQLLSVPFSLFSDNGIRSMTTEERDALVSPFTGMQIYNSTSNCLNYFNGTAWFETCGQCTPLPTQASAGEDQYFYDATFITTLQGNTPVYGTGQWSIVSGAGGNIANPENPASIFTGQAGTTYILKWTISTACGSTNDNVTIGFQGSPCGASFTDTRDGQVYPTVKIGSQCWMTQNLNIGTRIAGTTEQSNNATIEKYCYDNSEAKCVVYGGLYQWREMMNYSTTPGVQGICPPTGGWHLPTDAEWTSLTNYLGGESVAGGKMKETGTAHWFEPNTGATNSSGFTALPTGYRLTDGIFNDLSIYGYFWSTTEDGGSWAWYRYLSWSMDFVGRGNLDKQTGFSVRCLKNDTTTSQLNVTPANQDVTASSGTTSFEVTSNTSWTVEESVSWLSVSPINGSSNGTLTVSYDANSSSEARIGQITITAAGGNPVVNVTVTQAGVPQWNCGMLLTDTRDGKNYNTVQIGTQCWMAQNLNIGTRIEGGSDQGNNTILEKYCYNNSESKCDIYGGLYQWNEMMEYSTTPGAQGICPAGWHLPTHVEYSILTDFLGGTSFAGGKMKSTGTYEAGTGLWYTPNYGATNISGYTAFPAGRYGSNVTYYDLGSYAYYWSSSESGLNVARNRYLSNSSDGVSENNDYYKGWGFSVRCLKDN